MYNGQLNTYTPPQGLWTKVMDESKVMYTCNEAQNHLFDYAYSQEAEETAVKAMLKGLSMTAAFHEKFQSCQKVVCFYKRESDKVIGMYLTFPGMDRAIAIDLYLTEDSHPITVGYIKQVGTIEERKITPVYDLLSG